MLDTLGHHNHFPGLQIYSTIPECNRHLSVKNDEDFVSIIEAEPYKVALKFNKLKVIIVHPGNNFRFPMVSKFGKFFF